MGFARAARRRDLTLNAMAFDPLSSSLEDPFEGRRDIERGLLRAVDPLRFGEDPLRALRVLRFAARFEFEAEEQLQALCRAMPVEELPSERLLDEIRKMLLQARRPSLGLRLGHALGLWPRVLPVREFPVESTSAALDRAAALAASLFPGPDPRGEALLHVALFHGLGPTGAEACMDRLGIYTSGGFPMRRALLHALEFSPGFDPDISDGGLRRLAWSSREVGGLPLLVACATCLSEGFDLARTMERVHALGLEQTAPPPLIRGRELRQAGISPGPEMGRLLEELHALQLEEGIEDPEVLRARLIERLGRSSSQS
jgi:tRNA nucleotidyltransferase (CCA-adding enzyme)